MKLILTRTLLFNYHWFLNITNIPLDSPVLRWRGWLGGGGGEARTYSRNLSMNWESFPFQLESIPLHSRPLFVHQSQEHIPRLGLTQHMMLATILLQTKSALGGWRGQYYTCCLHFSRMFFPGIHFRLSLPSACEWWD